MSLSCRSLLELFVRGALPLLSPGGASPFRCCSDIARAHSSRRRRTTGRPPSAGAFRLPCAPVLRRKDLPGARPCLGVSSRRPGTTVARCTTATGTQSTLESAISCSRRSLTTSTENANRSCGAMFPAPTRAPSARTTISRSRSASIIGRSAEQRSCPLSSSDRAIRTSCPGSPHGARAVCYRGLQFRQ